MLNQRVGGDGVERGNERLLEVSHDLEYTLRDGVPSAINHRIRVLNPTKTRFGCFKVRERVGGSCM